MTSNKASDVRIFAPASAWRRAAGCRADPQAVPFNTQSRSTRRDVALQHEPFEGLVLALDAIFGLAFGRLGQQAQDLELAELHLQPKVRRTHDPDILSDLEFMRCKLVVEHVCNS